MDEGKRARCQRVTAQGCGCIEHTHTHTHTHTDTHTHKHTHKHKHTHPNNTFMRLSVTHAVIQYYMIA